MLAQRNKNAIIAILFTEIALLAVFGSIVIPNTEVGYGDGPLLLFFVLPAIGSSLLTQDSSTLITIKDPSSSML